MNGLLVAALVALVLSHGLKYRAVAVVDANPAQSAVPDLWNKVNSQVVWESSNVRIKSVRCTSLYHIIAEDTSAAKARTGAENAAARFCARLEHTCEIKGEIVDPPETPQHPIAWHTETWARIKRSFNW